MFVVKFNQTSNAPFTADKNGNMPFIGTVLAGSAKSTLINGTMFVRDGLVPNKIYLCDNVEETYEGKIQNRVQVISEVNLTEYPALRTMLGSPIQPKSAEKTSAPVAVTTAEELFN
jgi:hypothetical protein